jgi:Family of unknown function (DUF5996)
MTRSGMSADAARWPALPLDEWQETRDALHLWSQVVGKVRLALEPMLNHWWQVPLYVSARGLTTSLMHLPSGGCLEMEFDFVDEVLVARTCSGEVRHVQLASRSVASFYAETMDALHQLGVHVAIVPRPVEVSESIPFAEDLRRRDYDGEAARRFWRALVQAERVMKVFRARFIGKASRVHFFWGSFDLAVTRFSGRTAPRHPGGVPNCPDRVQQLAYSHEVSSCGFWPGGAAEGSFYAYAYPQLPGFEHWQVTPAAAYYDSGIKEFLLPYEAVRTADDPDALLLSFLQSTYEAAAELARWPRAALEADWAPVG